MIEEYQRISNAGERVLEGDSPRLLRPHQERYDFSLQFISPEDHVLDCACGSGYGSATLAKRAAAVTGIDISEEALAYCKKKYSSEKLNFLKGTAEKIPVPDHSIDVYCSFETIEHVQDPDALLIEAKRVLKEKGIFLVSTPNRVTTGLASGEKPNTPFHVMEWSLLEFHNILKRHFNDVTYFGQRVRCPNKFDLKYVTSKLKRALGVRDFVSIDLQSSDYIKMDHFPFWQPESFYAICRVT